MRKRNLLTALVLLAGLFLFTSQSAYAIPCAADLDCNGCVDLFDLVQIKTEFGTSDCDACMCDPIYECPVGLADCSGLCVNNATDELNCGTCDNVCEKGQGCVDGVCGVFYPISLPKTGQTASYATGDDGEYQMGVAWPDPRFTDNSDGTVTDNLTGLIWLKNANCFGQRTWSESLSDCNGLASGSCGLTDGSVAGDWRLPNKQEFISIIDDGNFDPPLSTGHPFSGVQDNFYWSSTSYAGNTSSAWNLFMYYGGMGQTAKIVRNCVWPVSNGNDYW